MKNAYLLGILAVCLTACGGGGGNGGGNNTANTATAANNTAADNASNNNPNSGNTSNNHSNDNNTSDNHSNDSNTPDNNSNDNNTSDNNSNNSDTEKTYTPETTTNVKYENLTLAQDNIYLTPQAGTQSTAESFKVKPMTASQKQAAQEIVDYTNKLRAEKGLPALVLDTNLTAFAQRRAEELVSRYAHERPDNSSIFDEGLQYGGGENIAAGYETALSVSKGWENSPGHYANMIRKGFTKIGIGVVAMPGSQYSYQWVQIFGYEDTTTPYRFDESASAAQTKLADATAKLRATIPPLKWISLENGMSFYIADIPRNGDWKSFTDIATHTYNGVINGYDDVNFGALKGQGEKYQVFYRGNNTLFEEMPQSGTFDYQGKAFMTDGSGQTFLNAAFQADFGNKKLDGVLSQEGKNMLGIHAVIRGNSFHSNQDAQVETQGGFFGPQATELGGVFYDHGSDQYGAYGAKQK